jgi:hypothetical protein
MSPFLKIAAVCAVACVVLAPCARAQDFNDQDFNDQQPIGDQYPNYAPLPPPPPQYSSMPSDDPATQPETWGETPYAVMVPPVMRDQPVDSETPMTPFNADAGQ